MKKLYTFGEFLNYMMEKRGITILELQNRLGLKSRTMIYRVLQEEAKYSTILDMKDDISNVLELTPLEVEEMETSLRVSEYGKETINTQKRILEFLKNTKTKTIPDTDFRAIQCFSETSYHSLEELFESYANCDEIHINMTNCISKEYMYKLSNFVQKNHSNFKSISIDHVIQLNKSSSKNIDILECILELLTFKHYNAFYNPDINMIFDEEFSLLSDIAIIKSIKDTEEFISLIKLDQKNQILNYHVSKDINLYNFYMNMYSQIKNLCRPLTVNFDNEDFVQNLCDISEYFYENSKSNDIYLLKSNPCYDFIKPSTIINMVQSSADFKELLNTDAIKTFELLIKNLEARHINILDKKENTIDIYSQEGINKFIADRRLSDHIPGMRNFTLSEIKEILCLTRNMHLAKDSSFHFYILNETIINYYILLGFMKNKSLFLESYENKYLNNYRSVIITSKIFLDNFENFFENILLKDHVMSEEESIAFLDEKIKEVDDMIKQENK
ncbi:MAG TPA: hypothetical protein DCP90_00065 [Clostridiales bacterium]|nr:MAG: hypothetical protein A2Y22_02620 [Clostridiales bacterium GWD2_32_59]HAN08989.1 hypothetical protein [Clostridiales bacterium]